MANLSELDLQNLRHLIGGYDTTHCKMKEYASCAEDPKVKQFFEQGAKVRYGKQTAADEIFAVRRKTDHDAGKNNGI